jgi:divalent metal cation (Fe/Co/Zn/Cd) transporter
VNTRFVAAFREIALADPAVAGLGVVLTMQLRPDDVLLNIEVQFTEGLPAEEIHAAAHRVEERITEPYPEASRIVIEVEALRVAAAAEPPA